MFLADRPSCIYSYSLNKNIDEIFLEKIKLALG